MFFWAYEGRWGLLQDICWAQVGHMVNMLRALVKGCGIHPINGRIVPVHTHIHTLVHAPRLFLMPLLFWITRNVPSNLLLKGLTQSHRAWTRGILATQPRGLRVFLHLSLSFCRRWRWQCYAALTLGCLSFPAVCFCPRSSCLGVAAAGTTESLHKLQEVALINWLPETRPLDERHAADSHWSNAPVCAC